MVWPPPKVLKSPEGELTIEPPRGSSPEVSSVVPGVQQHEAAHREAAHHEAMQHGAAHQPAAHREGVRPPPLPGATVSVMAATAVPRDWLERPEALIGCVLGSRYRIVGVIGRGPMGIACEGESSRGRQVTLKLLPRAPELPVEHFGWQLRQALALAHFDHPNVTPISDFGPLEDGGAFVSRSRVPGVSLRTILRQGPLPLARSLDIARQIASALAAGHQQDIAHGRLKPENLIIQGGPRGTDVVKVVDFGMAGLPVNLRAVAPNEEEARRLALRTRLYLPADLTGASPALDVYSLGVVLFEMIAGQPPFAFEVPPPPGADPAPLTFAQVNPGLNVPASVNELVFSLLHPKALEHGLNAARVGEMLDGLLGRPSVAPPGEPVTAQLPSAAARAPEPQTAKLTAPDPASFAASAASMVWPSAPAPAPARPHSFPPLPQGFVSSFPPRTIDPSLSPSNPAPADPRATDPRPSDPRISDPRISVSEARPSDPNPSDPRISELPGAPRALESRPPESRPLDQRPAEQRSAPHLQPVELTPADAESADSALQLLEAILEPRDAREGRSTATPPPPPSRRSAPPYPPPPSARRSSAPGDPTPAARPSSPGDPARLSSPGDPPPSARQDSMLGDAPAPYGSSAPGDPPASARRPPSLTDEPFGTPTYPPPSVSVPQAPPNPSISIADLGAGPPSFPPQPSNIPDLEDMELRPSFIGRLKRLFGKKRPDEF